MNYQGSLAATKTAKATVIVYFDDGARSLSCALTLHPQLKPTGVRSLIRMTTDGGLTALLDGDAGDAPLAGMVHPFSLLRLASGERMLFDDDVDTLPKAIYEAWVEKRKKSGDTVEANATPVPWEQLPEKLKERDREVARDISPPPPP